MTAPSSEHVIVPTRFRGPPGSGNGGYVAGVVAALVQGSHDDEHAVEISLQAPPPLETPLEVRRTDDAVLVGPEDTPVARGRCVADDLEAVDPVELEVAATASSGFPGLAYHPFPSCFACGTGRDDGLRIFPGPVETTDDGLTRVAATWTPAADLTADFHDYDDPTPRAAPAITWAALDCIGG
ncbi:MAG: hypothetical protein JWO46_1278, partial [Nocardioidaceae bacterium]|nr:hypothetical protein [Nocardioidaceae bacterium]